ncbi:hypothetical protein ABRZ00_12810 [Castellaniella ginsengisoli]|uniref:Uncharacterized protein n=1 Tax=Castellaniella ginsengisoli TaxID=546114 RepID=A0AB39DNU6_9BURK
MTVEDRPLTGHDLLWNWARWCWTGETPGNMARYVPQEDDHRPIMVDHALAVQVLYERLPRHEMMIIQAEYTRKNSWFGSLSADGRRTMARRWIQEVTGAVLRQEDYVRLLERFQRRVETEVLR